MYDEAVDRIKAILKSNRESLAFAAPEAQQLFWDRMQEDLEDLIDDVITECRDRYT